MEAIVSHLLKEVHQDFSASKCLSDHILKKLWTVFQLPLLGALDIIDRHGVLRISSPSGRVIYEVTGTSGTHYQCFSTGTYCSCPAFVFSILRRGEHIMVRKSVWAL